MITLWFVDESVLWQYNGSIFIEGSTDFVPGFVDAIIGTIEYTFQWLAE